MQLYIHPKKNKLLGLYDIYYTIIMKKPSNLTTDKNNQNKKYKKKFVNLFLNHFFLQQQKMEKILMKKCNHAFTYL